MTESTPPLARAIRSFVLRQGRISTAQQRAYDTLLPKYGIAYAPGPLDFAAVFGRAAPVILEIGFGMGETTAAIASAQPDRNFLAIEVHTPGVGSLLKQLEADGLTNVRVIQHDAVEVLNTMLPPASLAGCHLYFPDPWPKKRHHKRRLVQGPLIALLASRLAPGAYFHAATDWQEYADWMLDVLRAEPLLENTAEDFAPRPAWRPQTKFETRGLRLGHGVWDLLFRRR
ncbi:MAG: tRNA (guanosine(46)-N7)-methyltransferase TrmB [Burkholderiales bacterium]